jgi:D-alanyl-D-alanine dipeptidase
MENDEWLISNDNRMPKKICHSDFGFLSSFEISQSSFPHFWHLQLFFNANICNNSPRTLMKIFSAANSVRRFSIAMLFFAAISCGLSQSKPAAPHQDVLAVSRQLVLVTTKDWNAVPGTMKLFERDNPNGNWKQIGARVEIVVGRNGLGWGRGLNDEIKSEPQKKEGDGKSPAGIFNLSIAFGFAPASEMHLKLPYQQVTEMLECIDDIKSTRYNSIVDRSHIANPDWNSSEKMLAIGEAYRLGVVVDHNVSPHVPGKGSCIFLHIWKGDGSGTSGCTAMEKSQMEKLIHWLDANANPVLVQLPEKEFHRLQTVWKLPSLKTGTPKSPIAK